MRADPIDVFQIKFLVSQNFYRASSILTTYNDIEVGMMAKQDWRRPVGNN